MLGVCNKPDADSEMSPAQILFGRPLRDVFAFTIQQDKFTHHLLRSVWWDAWKEKEDRRVESGERRSGRARKARLCYQPECGNWDDL